MHFILLRCSLGRIFKKVWIITQDLFHAEHHWNNQVFKMLPCSRRFPSFHTFSLGVTQMVHLQTQLVSMGSTSWICTFLRLKASPVGLPLQTLLVWDSETSLAVVPRLFWHRKAISLLNYEWLSWEIYLMFYISAPFGNQEIMTYVRFWKKLIDLTNQSAHLEVSF